MPRISALSPLLLVVLGLGASGCATLTRGTTQEISISSEPTGATVTLGEHTAVTPSTFMIKRSDNPMAQVTKEGYQPLELNLDRKVSWICTTSNIFVGGPFSTTTDFVSGAAFEFEPGKYHVSLTPIGGKTSDAALMRQRVIAFTLGNHRALAVEAAQGGGERVTTLCEIAGIATVQRPSFVAAYLVQAEKVVDPVELAHWVADQVVPVGAVATARR